MLINMHHFPARILCRHHPAVGLLVHRLEKLPHLVEIWGHQLDLRNISLAVYLGLGDVVLVGLAPWPLWVVIHLRHREHPWRQSTVPNTRWIFTQII